MEAIGEEYECAVYLERHGQVKAWVRNTSRQPQSFWLQTSSDNDSKEKRLVGDLWADCSAGKGLFPMIENKEFGKIDQAIGCRA